MFPVIDSPMYMVETVSYDACKMFMTVTLLHTLRCLFVMSDLICQNLKSLMLMRCCMVRARHSVLKPLVKMLK